jgi:hypothetical protein
MAQMYHYSVSRLGFEITFFVRLSFVAKGYLQIADPFSK